MTRRSTSVARILVAVVGVLGLSSCTAEGQRDPTAAATRQEPVTTRAEQEALAPDVDLGSVSGTAGSGRSGKRVSPEERPARPRLENEETVEKESPWDAVYTLDGAMTVSTSLGARSFDAPTEMTSTYFERSKSVTFYARSGGGDDPVAGLGMALEMTSVDGGGFRRLSIITPHSQGGTVTYGFPLRQPVEWLSLEVGGISSAVTTNRSYRLTVLRSEDTRWQVRVEPSGLEAPKPWFERGVFDIVASSPAPPWEAVDISFETFDGSATTTGSFRLRRR